LRQENGPVLQEIKGVSTGGKKVAEHSEGGEKGQSRLRGGGGNLFREKRLRNFKKKGGEKWPLGKKRNVSKKGEVQRPKES